MAISIAIIAGTVKADPNHVTVVVKASGSALPADPRPANSYRKALAVPSNN